MGQKQTPTPKVTSPIVAMNFLTRAGAPSSFHIGLPRSICEGDQLGKAGAKNNSKQKLSTPSLKSRASVQPPALQFNPILLQSKEEGEMSSSTLHSQIGDPLFRISPFLARAEVNFNNPPFIVVTNSDRYLRLVVSDPKAKEPTLSPAASGRGATSERREEQKRQTEMRAKRDQEQAIVDGEDDDELKLRRRKTDNESLTPPDLSDTLIMFHANETCCSIVLPEDSDDAAHRRLAPISDIEPARRGKEGQSGHRLVDLDAVPKSPPNKKRLTELARELQKRKTKTELLIDETVGIKRARVQLELGCLKAQEEEYEAREREGERALSALQADLDSLLSECNILRLRIVQTKGQQHAAQNKLGRLHLTPFLSPADVSPVDVSILDL
ncbi:hypothetical protein BLNAU_5622 [Blattamonas nauphoetae]|uniref:Uncharacterized protein n=1 Tax=Blattamonas nauphoetae TaxID=2049346 RepID=A0ABQ9Y6G2_9EUKA|nr:hypothetical protein BLNAU_5622 [Blattamonas nauphoetae]